MIHLKNMSDEKTFNNPWEEIEKRRHAYLIQKNADTQK